MLGNIDWEAFDEGFYSYQNLVQRTKQYDTETFGIIYPSYGLMGEVGEIMEKQKRVLRGDADDIDINDMTKELGDVLWYLTALATDLGIDLTAVAETNMRKLVGRLARDTIKGEGDDRDWETRARLKTL